MKSSRRHDEGFSLVELIVAIAVGSIVAAAVASIIVISVRMYSRETTNIDGQYEIQTTLNQTVDSAESAQWVAFGQDVNAHSEVINTRYIAFGKLIDVSGSMCFEGVIFADDYDATDPGKFNVYMKRYSGGALDVGSEDTAGDAISTEASLLHGQSKYLLGEGATKYVVKLDEGANNITDDTSVAGYVGYFENPVVFDISMDFSRSSISGDITKHAEDKVTLRNRLKKALYIEGKGYYRPKE